jgi:2-polyprenyl-3-methyl-5-hydroxy-6-metoxy-1,4-benzoquinol methylase
MIKPPKIRLQGIAYLALHPRQLKHVTNRELRFRHRLQDRRRWIEWQEYDAYNHIQLMETHTVELNNHPLQLERTKTISNMVNGLDSLLSVLDVGCGNGAICSPIRKMGHNVTCVELAKVARLTHRCGVQSVMGGDAENLSFATESFDLVLASEVVEHLWTPENFFNEAYRILKPHGYLILSTPEGKLGLNYDSHKHYFTLEILKQMIAPNFTVCQAKHLEPNGDPTPTLIVLLQKLTTANN